MAFVNMNTIGDGNRKASYEYTIELSATENSSWILVPPCIARLSITISFSGGGTGNVEFTTDSVDTVKFGTPVAVTWDFGTVSVTTQDACDPPTALRLVQVASGTSKLTVKGSL